jgi:hypothetical protein
MSHSKDHLEACLDAIWSRENDFEIACTDLAEAEHAFKIKEAKEFLSADGSVDARKATALVNCEALHGDYLKKKAIKEFSREKLRDAQDALSARQSLLSYEVKTNFGYTQQV